MSKRYSEKFLGNTDKQTEHPPNSVFEDEQVMFFENCFGGVKSRMVQYFNMVRQRLHTEARLSGTHLVFDSTHAPQPVAETADFKVYRSADCDLQVVNATISSRTKLEMTIMANPRIRMVLDQDEEANYQFVPFTEERWVDAAKPVCTDRQVCRKIHPSQKVITPLKDGVAVFTDEAGYIEISVGHYQAMFDGELQTRRTVIAMLPKSMGKLAKVNHQNLSAFCNPVRNNERQICYATIDVDGFEGQSRGWWRTSDAVVTLDDPKGQVYVPVPADNPNGCEIRRSSLFGMEPTLTSAKFLSAILEQVITQPGAVGTVCFASSTLDVEEIAGDQHIDVEIDGKVVPLISGKHIRAGLSLSDSLAGLYSGALMAREATEPLLLVPNAARLTNSPMLYRLESFDRDDNWCHLPVNRKEKATRLVNIDQFEELVATGKRNPTYPEPMASRPTVPSALERLRPVERPAPQFDEFTKLARKLSQKSS